MLRLVGACSDKALKQQALVYADRFVLFGLSSSNGVSCVVLFVTVKPQPVEQDDGAARISP